MASKQKKTTMAKLNREQKLRERRMDKQARKEARKLEPVVVPSEDTPEHEAAPPADEA